MTMKRMRSVMNCSLCFAWLDESSQKVVSIAVIQADMTSDLVDSDSLIFYSVTKL